MTLSDDSLKQQTVAMTWITELYYLVYTLRQHLRLQYIGSGNGFVLLLNTAVVSHQVTDRVLFLFHFPHISVIVLLTDMNLSFTVSVAFHEARRSLIYNVSNLSTYTALILKLYC